MLLLRKALLISLATITYTAQAANPFLPGWEYIPDGEPRVFGDRVYLYGSHDRAGSKEFCDTILRVWSAPLADLNTWTDHGIIFSTRTVDGHADDVGWSDNNLYAPDVIKKDGRYYLFAQIVGAPCAVAVSDYSRRAIPAHFPNQKTKGLSDGLRRVVTILRSRRARGR